MSPRVTVLMPVYNAEVFLREAVESVLAQTFRDFELLVVDDASTDASPAILQSFRDARIRILRNERRLKLAGALNRGLREARGACLARMDADDVCRPDRLARQVAFLEAHPEIGLVGAWMKRFGNRPHHVERYPVGVPRVRAYTLFYTPFAHPTVLLRREWFLKHGLFYDGGYNPTEDFELWERALRIFPGDNLPETLLDYRVHGAGMTGSDWEAMDRQAGRILARGLRRLGFDPDPEHVRFHREIARGRIERTPETLRRAEAWLTGLLTANHERNVFDPAALRQLVQDVFQKLCLRMAGAGWWALRHYLSSPLSTGRRADAIPRIAWGALTTRKNIARDG